MKAGFSHFIVISFFSLCLGSCSNLTVREFCASRSPRFQAAFEDAELALRPWKQEGEGRGLAASAPLLPEQDRDAWQAWAEEKLKDTQNYQDLVEHTLRSPAIKKELNLLANQLVSFHGYCQQGRATRMIAALSQAQKHAQAVRNLACSGE